MAKMIHVNLPVADLGAATRFYEALGCTKNPQFSDENAASMVWSESINFQLLSREYSGGRRMSGRRWIWDGCITGRWRIRMGM